MQRATPAREDRTEAPSRHGAPGHTDAPGSAAGLRAELAERTEDLQRVKAEFDNYRKRMRRDRAALGQIAVANVLTRLLPVLDVIEQAREHGEVSGDFATVADALEDRLAALGLEPVGSTGEPFDPLRHEALSAERSTRVDQIVCGEVLRYGYRVGDHLLRPAQVVVAEPPPAHGSGQRPATDPSP